MSNAMTTIIASACMGLSGSANDACVKALDAGSRQTGIEQDVNMAQKTIERKANKEAYVLIGHTGMEIAGGGIFITKAVIDKSVQFNMPTMGMCDRITNNVGHDKYFLLLEWGF